MNKKAKTILSKSTFLGTCRKQELCIVRFKAYSIMREKGFTLCEIAKIFNRKNHGSVFNGLKSYSQLTKYNPYIVENIIKGDMFEIEGGLTVNEFIDSLITEF